MIEYEEEGELDWLGGESTSTEESLGRASWSYSLGRTVVPGTARKGSSEVSRDS